VQIFFLIGEAMMMPVMSGPPEHAFLRGRSGHNGDDELKPAAGLERTVRKIAVISRSNEKHAHEEDGQAGNQIRPAEMHEKYRQSREMNDGKRNARENLKTSPVGQGYR
jgi:hypothetical protein